MTYLPVYRLTSGQSTTIPPRRTPGRPRAKRTFDIDDAESPSGICDSAQERRPDPGTQQHLSCATDDPVTRSSAVYLARSGPTKTAGCLGNPAPIWGADGRSSNKIIRRKTPDAGSGRVSSEHRSPGGSRCGD